MTFSRGSALFPAELSDFRCDTGLRSSRTFRIALLIPLCGSAGIWAPSCISSAQVAVDELNRGDGIDGRQVQLIMIDSALESQLPIEEVVNDLIESRSIDAIVGMHISAIRQRLSKIVRQRVPYIYTPLYEGGENAAGVFAIGETPKEQLGPAMEWLQQRFKPRNWALIGNDYVWPHMSHSFAKSKLKDMSASLAYERFLPFGLSDMSRYVDEIAQSGADALLMCLVGQDAVAFNRAFGSSGLDRRVVRLSCSVEENTLLACGARNLKRLYSSASYFAALRTEANAAFKERYYSLLGDGAPMLNTVGQSTYEGVHFLQGLLGRGTVDWRTLNSTSVMQVGHRSVRRSLTRDDDEMRTPTYIARADGIQFEVMDRL